MGKVININREPKVSDKLELNKDYHVWRDGNYLGITTFIEDRNIGQAFIKKKGDLIEVYTPDKWMLTK